MYNFDKWIDRNNTNSVKHGLKKFFFGRDDIIPLWVADMDYEAPDFIVEPLVERAGHPGYGYTFKSQALYDSIINWYEKRHKWKIDKKWMVFCPGIVPALHFAVMAYTKPGDKVIVQPPVYFPFFNAIQDNQRVILNNPLKLENGRYYMDFDNLENSIDNKTKLLVLCSPHNPCGRVWEKDELERLAEICLRYNIIIVSDEIHCDLVYKNHVHIPLASISDEIANQSVTFIAPSKTFNLAGLSTSVIVSSNSTLLDKINSFLDNTHVNSGNIFGWVAMEAAYTKGEKWLDELLHYLNENVLLMKDFFDNPDSRVRLIEPESTYLAWLDCRNLNLNDMELKNFMINEARIGLNDGPMFGVGGEGFQRLNFACPRSLLKQVLDRIEKSLKNI